MTELSVIIPIYNTPIPALQRCFDSVSAFREVLLIDDGSQAETGSFCLEYCRDHPNFRYAYQENGGVSSARNKGLSLATGQYITFLDADDELLPDGIVPSESDLVLYDILLRDGGSEWVWSALDQDAGPLTKKQLLYRLIATKSLNGPVAKLYKRSIIEENGLRFDRDFITGEDWNFVCDYALHAETITYQKTPVYRYFREAATSMGRLSRQPDTMLRNYLSMYQRKLDLAEMTDHANELKVIAAADLTETLFNTAADLLLLKLLTPERKALIRDAVAGLPRANSRKTRIKAAVINRHFWLLRPLAMLRALYLKIKH